MRSDAARWTAWGVFLVLLTAGSWWLLGRDADQGGLTHRVPVDVLGYEREVRAGRGPMSGHRVHYAYRVDGREFRDDRFIVRGVWEPGRPLAACVDPDDAAVHIILLRPGDECGEARDPRGVVTATGG